MLVIAVDQTLTNPQGLPFIFLPFPSSFFFFFKGIYKPEVQVFFLFCFCLKFRAGVMTQSRQRYHSQQFLLLTLAFFALFLFCPHIIPYVYNLH